MSTFTLPNFTLTVTNQSSSFIEGVVKFKTGTTVDFFCEIKRGSIINYPIGHGIHDGTVFVDTDKVTNLPVSAFVPVSEKSAVTAMATIVAIENDIGSLLDTLVEEF